MTTSPPKNILKRVEAAGGLPFVLVVFAIVLVAGSAVTWVTSSNWGKVTTSAPARTVGVIPDDTAIPSVPGTAKLIKYLSPNRIRIPQINADAPIFSEPTSSDNELTIPLNPRQVAWWSGGAHPGSPVGTAVFAGHINYAGVQGTLARIGTLNPGNMVYISGMLNAKPKTLAFKVVGVRTYSKSNLPFAQIFDQQVVGRVAIVTCGGPFDAQTGNYLDNIVVYAVPA